MELVIQQLLISVLGLVRDFESRPADEIACVSVYSIRGSFTNSTNLTYVNAIESTVASSTISLCLQSDWAPLIKFR